MSDYRRILPSSEMPESRTTSQGRKLKRINIRTYAYNLASQGRQFVAVDFRANGRFHARYIDCTSNYTFPEVDASSPDEAIDKALQARDDYLAEPYDEVLP